MEGEEKERKETYIFALAVDTGSGGCIGIHLEVQQAWIGRTFLRLGATILVLSVRLVGLATLGLAGLGLAGGGLDVTGGRALVLGVLSDLAHEQSSQRPPVFLAPSH